MAGITFDRLTNNIAEEEVVGNLVMVTFRCPVTEKLYHSIAAMREAPATPPTRTPAGAAHDQLRGAVRAVFAPKGPETEYDKVTGKPLPPDEGTNFDRAARERAVIEAFEAVAPNFVWDEGHQAYIDAERAHNPPSQFDLQLHDHPIEDEWDRLVTARMLAAIAGADGVISEDERRFFNGVLTRATGTLVELVKAGPPSSLELEETRPAARATMLMLAWALAMCDEQLDAKERKLLEKFARGLGVALEREELIRHWAADKVIESMLAGCYADGRLDDPERTRIEMLARNIGVNEALVAKIDVRVHRRLGG